MAHKKFGHQPWIAMVSPAIELARDGFTVSYALSQQLDQAKAELAGFPESKRIFLNGGPGFEQGDRLTQPELSSVLERIAKQ